MKSNKGLNMGEVGIPTGVRDNKDREHVLRTGDLVAYINGMKNIGISVVYLHPETGSYAVYGWGGIHLEQLMNDPTKEMRLVLPHNLVTQEILQFHQNSLLLLEPKELTLSEIEERLGYPIKLIKE